MGGLVGGIINFLAGWLFYGILFKEQFGGGDDMNMLFIFLGCLTFGFLMAYVFVKWASISTAMTGAVGGAVIAALSALSSDFFRYSGETNPDYMLILLDVGVMAVIGAMMGAGIGFVLSKMK